MNSAPLSRNELCILQLLWRVDKPLSRPEILDGIPNKDWNPNSIHLILNNMIQKGVLRVEGMTRCGRGYGRTYAPAITQSQYIASQALQVTPDVPQKERVLCVVASLIDSKGIDESTINELEEMLERKKKELHGK